MVPFMYGGITASCKLIKTMILGRRKEKFVKHLEIKFLNEENKTNLIIFSPGSTHMRQNSFLDTYCPENFKNHVTQENEIKASGNASKDDRTQLKSIKEIKCKVVTSLE